jgi:phosphoribosyl 1,2-cyclic phosphodiesterase
MLKVGPYPWSVKQRVMSRVGHLSNTVACDFLANELDSRTEHVVLGHVSEANNHPEIVRALANEALEQRGFFAPRVSVAEQSRPSDVIQF